MSRPLTSVGKIRRGERGQALPIAMGALALGTILVLPLLTGAGGGSKATGQAAQRTLERYRVDAGAEWSGWRLISDPQLTTVTTFTAVPLQPFPPLLNGSPFPLTEIKYVPSAGAVEAVAPAWQPGGGDKCYSLSVSEAGMLSARISIDAGQAWAILLPDFVPCVKPPLLPPLPGGLQVAVDLPVVTSGTYQLLVSTDAASAGSIALSVPAATYEVQSTSGSTTLTTRVVAGYSGIRFDSWQFN